MADTPQLDLRHARDIAMFWALNRSGTISASIVGRVIRRNKRRDDIFFSIHDASGVIECKASRRTVSEDIWESQVTRTRKGDRVSLKGAVSSYTSRGRVQPMVDVLHLERQSSDGSSQLDNLLKNLSAVGSGFFIARLKRAVAHELFNRGFEEFEPRYINNTRPHGSLEPLRVVFPGYGSPAFLQVSPLSSLRAAARVTGCEKVFAIARSFSQTVRDGYTSAEQVVAGLVVSDRNLHQLIDLCIEVVSACFGGYMTMASNWSAYALIDSWDRQQFSLTSAEVPIVNRPTILETEEPYAFALAWPRLSNGGYNRHPLLVAEGSVETIELDLTDGSAIIHIERMARAIRDDLTLRA